MSPKSHYHFDDNDYNYNEYDDYDGYDEYEEPVSGYGKRKERDDYYDEYEALANVKRTSSLSSAALCAGIMSVITVFGGYTAVLGMVFAFIGLIAGKRGLRRNPTTAARWAVRISVLGLILCSFVTLLFVCFYVFSMVGDGISGDSIKEHIRSFDLHGIYDRMKAVLISIIDRL